MLDNFFESLSSTIFLTLGVGLLSIGLAFFNSLHRVAYNYRFKEKLEILTLCLLLFPCFVLALIYREVFSASGPLTNLLEQRAAVSLAQVPFQSLAGYLFCLAISAYPLFYLVFRPLQEAHLSGNRRLALEFQAPKKFYFFKMTLPFFAPAIALSLLFVFAMVIGDHTTAQILGVRTLGTFLYRAWFLSYEQAALVRGSILVCLIVYAGVALILLLSSRDRYDFSSTPAPVQTPARGLRLFLIYLLGGSPVLLGLIIPLLLLSYWTSLTIDNLMMRRFFEIVRESLFIAGSVTVVTLVLGFLFVIFLRRRKNSSLLESLLLSSSIGYLLPPLALAFALQWGMSPLLAKLDSPLPFLVQIGEILRFLGPVVAVFFLRNQQISLAYERLFDCHNLNFARRLRLFYFPMFSLAFSLLSAFLMIESLKDVIMPLTLRPFTYSTLSVEAFMLLTNNYTKESSVLILSLVLCAAYPIYFFIHSPGGFYRKP